MPVLEAKNTTNRLDAMAGQQLQEREERQLRRTLPDLEVTEGKYVRYQGKKLLSFCSNDYLGLAWHPQVIAAAQEATERWGAGAGASRLVTGNHPLYAELEQALARLKGTEAALVCGSGYLANIGLVPALAGKGDLVLVDKLSHSCILDGAKLSQAVVRRFRHNDIRVLAKLLEKRGGFDRCIIITETVFSMDGDCAPLAAIRELADQHNAWLITDDAHGLGVVESHTPAHIQMGTLSKALGSYGGYICASQAVVELLINNARSFIYSTALPPSAVAAALASVKVINKDDAIKQLPLLRARLFCNYMGISETQSPIVSWVVEEEERALALQEELIKCGFYVAAIRPPTVPPGTSRLRLTFSALHTEQEVLLLADAIKSLMQMYV